MIVGFGDKHKVGYWTPVRLTIEGRDAGEDGEDHRVRIVWTKRVADYVQMLGLEAPIEDLGGLFGPVAEQLGKGLAGRPAHPLPGLLEGPGLHAHGLEGDTQGAVDDRPSIHQGVVPIEQNRARPLQLQGGLLVSRTKPAGVRREVPRSPSERDGPARLARRPW